MTPNINNFKISRDRVFYHIKEDLTFQSLTRLGSVLLNPR